MERMTSERARALPSAPSCSPDVPRISRILLVMSVPDARAARCGARGSAKRHPSSALAEDAQRDLDPRVPVLATSRRCAGKPRARCGLYFSVCSPSCRSLFAMRIVLATGSMTATSTETQCPERCRAASRRFCVSTSERATASMAHRTASPRSPSRSLE